MPRFVLPLLIIVCLFSCKNELTAPPLTEHTESLRNPGLKPFYHGVASGDPYPESVILWTRVTPETQLSSIPVGWEVSEKEDFSTIFRSGSFTTRPERDYTVKVEAKGLHPGTQYFYRFKALGQTSMTGKTRSAANDAEQLRFAFVSCSNYEWGYFNAYAQVAKEKDLSAVVHLGDYIYEYGPGGYGDTTIGRVHIPDHEIVSLQDYRDRYAQYRLDPDLRAAHARHPFIAIWDDHEITNNSYKNGAQNHQPDEGDYETRKAIAKQVYYEWLPIRESEHHYRSFSFGKLADLIMLDERLAGRTQQADSLTDPRLNAPDQALLGSEQMGWFAKQLSAGKGQWKLIGNQVIYSYLNWGYSSFSINLDSWDGYPAEQQQVADLIQTNAIENVIFLTGDTHRSWAFEATNQPKEYASGKGAFAVEFGVTSINSGNADERFPADSVIAHENKIVNSSINPHLKYCNMRDHGYVLLSIDGEKAVADFRFVGHPNRKSDQVGTGKSFVVKTGETVLTENE
ncbi:MAG: alkaline phosphatase D family protein [Bacteroidota bacterium]